MRPSMSAEIPRATASGLIIAKVRSFRKLADPPISFHRFFFLALLAFFFTGLAFALAFDFRTSLRLRPAHHPRDRLTNIRWTLNRVNAGSAHRLVFFDGCAVP